MNEIEKTLDKLKRNAKRIHKEKGIPHWEALDLVAMELGYAKWSHFHKSATQAMKDQEKKTGAGK